MTASFSGKAFSVTNARGKFRFPIGHDFSVQRVRRYPSTLLIWSVVSMSLNEGMIWEKARAGPPLVIWERHWTSGSGVVVGQSVKSGKVAGRSKPATASGVPLPSGPWQATHPAL